MKRVTAGLVVLLALGVAPAQAQDDILVKLYTEARQAESAGNYPLATQRYERIVALRPGMAEAHANLGNLYYVQGMRDQAAACFRKAIRLKPSLAAPHLLLGVLCFRSRDLDQALVHLREAERLDSSNTLATLYIGYALYLQDRYPEAVVALEAVTAGDRDNADAWYHLSKLHGQLSQQYFDKLQVGYPDSFFTALARSHFFESGGNWEQAALELNKAIEIDKSRPGLRQRLEWLTQRVAGNTETAPEDETLAGSTRYLYSPPAEDKLLETYSAERMRASKLPDKTKSEPENLYELADVRQALSFLSSLRVLQMDPDSYRAHELRGEALEAGGKTDEAIAEYRKALALKPELETVHFTIGNIYWRAGRMEEALAELAEELKVNPSDPHAHYESGDILLSQNKLDEAKKHFLIALKFSPGMTEAHMALERIASAGNDTAAAILHLKKAAELAPANSAPHYRLWLLYRKLGRETEAKQERAIFEKLKALERK
jgi:tetratricopeptide (TPR) repeat protein